MSKYTTGEMAKLCGVSVRTVQYYDTRGILTPSELSEGGRRLYTEQELRKMKIICFLRDAGVPINSIGEIFSGQDPEAVVASIVEQQKKELELQMQECRKKAELLDKISRSMKNTEHFSVESLGDIACMTQNQNEMKKLRKVMLASAIPLGIMEWTSVLLWIFQGIWWPFALYTALAIPYTVWIFSYYWKRVAYICPQCHTHFQPRKREFFFASHTFTTRKVTCPCCGYKGFCAETSFTEQKNAAMSQ